MGGKKVNKKYQRLLQCWEKTVGPAEQFSLEHRVYNAFCLFTLSAVTYTVPFNYSIGLYWSSFFSSIFMVVLGISYFLSRFANRHQISFVITALSVNVYFGINYFFNAGINGPTLLLMALTYVPIMIVAPMKQYGLWSSINLLIVLTILVWEYIDPTIVVSHYPTRDSHFLDIASSYLVIFLMVKMCTIYMIKSYTQARQTSEKAVLDLQFMNEDKNKLFSIVSHDLRAPLSNIKGYLELLNDIDLPKDRKKKLEGHLLHATQNTLEMLTNLLSWSKSQMEGMDKHFTKLQLYPLVSPTLHLYKDIAHSKGISIENHMPEDTRVIGDENMLELVIRNLINNAIKFTSNGGHILVSATEEKDYSIIKIRDSGNGKPIRLSPDIFQLKGKATYGTQKEKGVGLGLVLCREFVEAQNGRIWFENDPVSGTTFFVAMPLAKSTKEKTKYQPHLSNM